MNKEVPTVPVTKPPLYWEAAKIATNSGVAGITAGVLAESFVAPLVNPLMGKKPFQGMTAVLRKQFFPQLHSFSIYEGVRHVVAGKTQLAKRPILLGVFSAAITETLRNAVFWPMVNIARRRPVFEGVGSGLIPGSVQQYCWFVGVEYSNKMLSKLAKQHGHSSVPMHWHAAGTIGVSIFAILGSVPFRLWHAKRKNAKNEKEFVLKKEWKTIEPSVISFFTRATMRRLLHMNFKPYSMKAVSNVFKMIGK